MAYLEIFLMPISSCRHSGFMIIWHKENKDLRQLVAEVKVICCYLQKIMRLDLSRILSYSMRCDAEKSMPSVFFKCFKNS